MPVRTAHPTQATSPRPQRPDVPYLQRRTPQLLLRTLPIARYRLRRLGWTGLTGLVLIVAALGAAVILLPPTQQSVTNLRTELAQTSHTSPFLVKPEQPIREFSNLLPTRDQVPAVLGVLITQAAAAGIALDQGRYAYSPPTLNRLARYTMEFPVKGDYAKVRNFIDRSLKQVPALGLDVLHVQRKNVGDLAVSADVGFLIYLRGS